jgi:hypothetical protein
MGVTHHTLLKNTTATESVGTGYPATSTVDLLLSSIPDNK